MSIKVKYKVDGFIERFKIKTIAQDFLQMPKIDYTEIFIPSVT